MYQQIDLLKSNNIIFPFDFRVIQKFKQSAYFLTQIQPENRKRCKENIKHYHNSLSPFLKNHTVLSTIFLFQPILFPYSLERRLDNDYNFTINDETGTLETANQIQDCKSKSSKPSI